RCTVDESAGGIGGVGHRFHALVVGATLTGCGGSAMSATYSVSAVESAFADHGVTLKRVAVPLPGGAPARFKSAGRSAVLLRADAEVMVWIRVDPKDGSGLSFNATGSDFRVTRQGNLVVGYRLARAT